jgi:hypothetical protein
VLVYANKKDKEYLNVDYMEIFYEGEKKIHKFYDSKLVKPR